MKKIVILSMICVLIFVIMACGKTKGQEEPDTGMSSPDDAGTAVEAREDNSAAEGKRILIAYFSWADNAILENDVDAISSPSVLVPGNVAQLAGWIQEKTAGELFSIQVTDPYSSDWDACLSRANQEKSDGRRPELKGGR